MLAGGSWLPNCHDQSRRPASFLVRMARNGATMHRVVREAAMDLREFVKETLSQIVQGVKEAQALAASHGGEVSPDMSRQAGSTFSASGFVHGPNGTTVQFVAFDVALTVTEGTGTKGGIGVVTGMFNLGSAGESRAENSSLSRVKFGVPLSLPTSARK